MLGCYMVHSGLRTTKARVCLLRFSHRLSIRKEQLKIVDNSFRPIFTLKSSFHILRLNQEWMPEWIKQGATSWGVSTPIKDIPLLLHCIINISVLHREMKTVQAFFVCFIYDLFCVSPHHHYHSCHEI